MNTEIVKHKMPFSEIAQMGAVFAESGMFVDAKSAAQAIVKIQAGQEIGVPPFAAMSGIHIIKGKPTIGAGLMAATVKGNGKYDYKVVEQNEKTCSIDFYQGKEKIGNSTFTIEEAKKAGTQNLDRFPKNMLFARAISNGIKWYCPDVFNGPVYVPEEMEQVTEEATYTVVDDKANAIAEMLNAKSEDEIKSIWAKHKQFTKAPEFIAATKQAKLAIDGQQPTA